MKPLSRRVERLERHMARLLPSQLCPSPPPEFAEWLVSHGFETEGNASLAEAVGRATSMTMGETEGGAGATHCRGSNPVTYLNGCRPYVTIIQCRCNCAQPFSRISTTAGVYTLPK